MNRSYVLSYMRDFLRWREGRQHSGYEKMLLGLNVLVVPWDCYLLRYTPGAEIGEHTDPVEGKRHFRLNVVIKEATRGGVFHCERALFRTQRVALFRPDKAPHRVSKIEAGVRYVFSVGWVLDAK